MSTEGVWAYAIVAAESAARRAEGLTGVAGEPVRIVAINDTAAAVGSVPLEYFGEEALRHNLEDLDWLGSTARAHDRVISHLARSGPVLPLRMTTVYLNDERVGNLLMNHGDDFTSALAAVAGRQELGVKAYADQKALRGTSDSPGAGKTSGTAYLLRRKRELSDQEETYSIAAQSARRLHDTLSRYAVDAKRKPVSDQSLSGRAGWIVLNSTYLVEDSQADEFRRAVEALNDELVGIELEVTGPWPPYSFTGDLAAS